MVAFSSDGDQRLLSVMRSQTQLNNLNLHGPVDRSPASIQDTIHEVLKFRSRFLKVSVLLPMGDKQVSVSHLKLLINRTSKDVHGLVMKDVCPDDKQNFKSMQKVMHPRVLDALIANVPDSQATVMYLKLCSAMESAMNDLDLYPTERIKRMYFSTSFLRIWRKWILNSEKYSLTNNWITLNAYACAEINAYNLVKLMRRLRENGEDDLFLPFLCNSQTCEQSFRQLRSMTTLNWTKINFSLLELTHMISRLELQNEIIHFKLADVGIEFPRINKKTNQFKQYPLPSDEEIGNAIEIARKEAIREAKKFGMNIQAHQIKKCELPNVNINYDDAFLDDTDDENDNIFNELDRVDPFAFDECTELSGILEQNLCLKDYSEQADNIDEKSRFTKITDKNGASKIVRKSSVVWLLSQSNKEKLSSDRLQRVKGPLQKSSRRQLKFQMQEPSFGSVRLLYTSDEICLGQWVIFQNPSNPSKRSKGSDKVEDCIFGSALGFVYSKGKTDKEKQYSWDYASIGNENIEVLATWYQLNSDGQFISIKGNNSFYLKMTKYLMHMKTPSFQSDSTEGTCRIYLPNTDCATIQSNFMNILQSKRNQS